MKFSHNIFLSLLALGACDSATTTSSPADGGGTTLVDASGTTVDATGIDASCVGEECCSGANCPGIPEHLWSSTYDGQVGLDQGRAIATDADGNVLVCGPFNGTLSLNLPKGSTTFTSRGESDVFVIKFAPTGAILWAQSFGSTLPESCRGVATDLQGNVFLSGVYNGTMALNDGEDMLLPFAVGENRNAFAVSFASTGELRWARGVSGTGVEASNAIAVSGEHVYVVGHFDEQFSLSLTSGETVVTSAGSRDIFVVDFDKASGNVNWHHTYGGVGSDTAYGVAVTVANDKLHVTGNFAGEVGFGALGNTTALGTSDLFVLKINPEGEERVLSTFGAVGASANGRGIATTADRGVVVSGLYTGAIDFGSGVETATDTDAFVFSLDSTLATRWSQVFPGAGAARALDADVEDGEVFVTGQYAGLLSVGVTMLTSVGGKDAFVGSFALEDGAPNWAFGIGSTGTDFGWGAESYQGRLYVTGRLSGQATLATGVVLDGAADGDMFLGSYRVR